MWYKIYADGSLIDIIHANSPKEAISFAKIRHGDDAIWTYRIY